MSSSISRADAQALLEEWVESASLRRHCMAVETAMRAYAEKHGEDVELWGATGLLHDMDYEKHPDMDAPDGHPRTALRVLAEAGYPEELVRGVASHADFLGVSRDSLMEKTLAAVDELSGFLVACAAVRPEGIHGLTPKSVKKKLKQPSFAAAVSREEIAHNVADLGVELDEHIRFMVAALEARSDELELNGGGGGGAPAADSPPGEPGLSAA